MSKKYEGSSLGFWIIGIITVAVFAGIIVFAYIMQPKPFSSKTNREVALTCTTDMATHFHIHPVLKIMINGQTQELEKNIGITPNCMNSLHTHDSTGIIHVEAPEKRDFNLSDFFAVWGKTYSKDQILDFKVDENHTISQMVNGQDNTDYENLILNDKDEIVISYEEKSK